jgi:hypothetical protein
MSLTPFDYDKNKVLYGTTHLDLPLFELMQHFCDAKIYNHVYKEYDRLSNDLPLTMLDKNFLLEAMQVLTIIKELHKESDELR